MNMEEENLIEPVQKPRHTRKTRRLTWKERQYGSGFLNGMWCGIALGFPISFGVATLTKLALEWLLG